MRRSNVNKSRSLRKNQTDAEKKLWSVLRNRQLAGAKFRRQFTIDKYILDFYSPEYKISVEADGGQHFDEEGLKRDQERIRELESLDVRVLRFDNREILTNIEGVYEMILRAIEEIRQSPLTSILSPRGEEA